MLKTVDVTKEYNKGICALDNISINIEKGEFVFVVGPSGSGKSTLIKLLTKEEEPSRGHWTSQRRGAASGSSDPGARRSRREARQVPGRAFGRRAATCLDRPGV